MLPIWKRLISYYLINNLIILNKKINKEIKFKAKLKKEDTQLRKHIRFKDWKTLRIYMTDFSKKKKNNYCKNNS